MILFLSYKFYSINILILKVTLPLVIFKSTLKRLFVVAKSPSMDFLGGGVILLSFEKVSYRPRAGSEQINKTRNLIIIPASHAANTRGVLAAWEGMGYKFTFK